MKKKLVFCSSAAAIVCLASHPGHASMTDEAFVIFAEHATAPMTLPAALPAQPGSPAYEETSSEGVPSAAEIPTDQPAEAGVENVESVATETASVAEESVNQATSELRDEIEEADDPGERAGKFTATYFGIFYGPSISKPTSYQPTENGARDPDRPVMLKNFAGLGYNIFDHVRVTPTAYWQWMPSAGGAYSIQDPFIRLSDDAIISTEGFNLYADVRYHFPVSNFSKQADINGSYQSVQVLTYVPEGSRWMFGLFGSERKYNYGKKGYGNDFEVYIGPNLSYQLSHKLQLTMIYETNLVHVYGTNPGTMEGDGTDLQPGVSWDVTSNINFHPYLSIYPGNPSVSNTSVGALIYWQPF